MKPRYALFLSIIGIFLLTNGIFVNPNMAAQTNSQNQVTQTGDWFKFNDYRDESTSSFNNLVIANTSDQNQLFRYEENVNDEVVRWDGESDFTFIRQRATLPPIDTIIDVNSFEESLPGSQRTGHNYLWDQGANNGQGQWFNDTFPVEDLSGEYRKGNDNDRSFEFESNATYAMIYNIMKVSELNIPLEAPDPVIPNNFNGVIPLEYRDVYLDTDAYLINGVDQNLQTRVVDEAFSVFYEEMFTITIPIGPEEDPNTPLVPVDGTWWIDYFYNIVFTYEQNSGLLLNFTTDLELNIGVNLWQDNIILTPGPSQGFNINQEPSTLNVTFETENNYSYNRISGSYITDSSSFYGNTRPQSSGINVLEEGDIITYDLEMRSNVDGVSEVTATQTGTQTGNFYSHAALSYQTDANGDLSFDIYRHQPGFINAVIYNQGTISGSSSYQVEERENDQVTKSENIQNPIGPSDLTNWDIFEGGSSANREIQPDFDDTMHVNFDFLYDQCDGPDCITGEDFDIRMVIPQDIPKMGPLNETTFYINLLTIYDGETLFINGFEQYEFNVDQALQNYGIHLNQIIQVPMGGDNGEEPVWIDADMTYDVEGRIGFFYDDDTGALITMEREIHADLTITTEQSISYGPNPDDIITINIFFNSHSEEHFQIWLNGHPNHYSTSNTIPTSEITSSSTVISETLPPTEDSSQAGGLPLPVPILPVAISILLISIIRKKRH